MELHAKCLHGENVGTKQMTGLADWKDPSVIKSKACSYGRPKFGSQLPCSRLLPFVIQFPRDQKMSSSLEETCTHVHTFTHR